MFWSSWGSKSEFAKAAGVEASGRMRDQKIERRCGTKHISKSKCYKHQMFSTTFGHWSVALCGKPNGFCILPKVRKTWRFRDTCKNDGRCGTFQQDLQREFCAAGAIQETSSWNMLVRGWFAERAAFWSIRSSSLLRWLCVTGAALRMTWPHFLVAGVARSRQLCTQLFIFERNLVELLCFWCCRIRLTEEVWTDLFRRFGCCQLLFFEEVSQNSFLSDRQTDRQIDRQIDRQREREK